MEARKDFLVEQMSSVKECASRLTPRVLPRMTGYYRQGSLMVVVDRKMGFKAKVFWSNELLEGWGYQ